MAENQITVELDKSVEVTLGDNTVTVEAASVNTIRGFVPADTRFPFNGMGGNTYFIYVSATSKFELWVNGVKKREWS